MLLEGQTRYGSNRKMQLGGRGGGGSQKLEILNVENNIIFSKSLRGLLLFTGPPKSTDKNM